MEYGAICHKMLRGFCMVEKLPPKFHVQAWLRKHSGAVPQVSEKLYHHPGPPTPLPALRDSRLLPSLGS